jgi:hypothetical protein
VTIVVQVQPNLGASLVNKENQNGLEGSSTNPKYNE